MRVLVVYESKYGQSAKIAQHIAQVVRMRGYRAVACEVGFAREVDLAQQDAVFVVAPVYFSRHPKTIRHVVARRAAHLSAMPSALVSVSGSASSAKPDARAAVRSIADAMCRVARWRPTVIATVGGAIAYPRYNWLLRAVMKRIVASEGGPTDTSRSYETTDWKEVEAVVERILAELPAPKSSDHTHQERIARAM